MHAGFGGHRHIGVIHCKSSLGRSVDHGKIEDTVRGIETIEQAEDLIHRPIATRRRLVDFIDHHQDGETRCQGLLDHEESLRHRTFLGINQEHRAVRHAQHPLHLTAKVGMTGGVDDIDLIVPVDVRSVFRGDGDTALTLKIHGIHEPLRHLLIVTKHTALSEQLIDKRCFPMVNMGDNSDIPNKLLLHTAPAPARGSLWSK